MRLLVNYGLTVAKRIKLIKIIACPKKVLTMTILSWKDGLIMKFSSVFFIFCVILSVGAANAAPYLPDAPGQVIEYIGEMKIGDETQSVSQTIKVLEHIIHPDTSEKLIVHQVYVTAAGEEDTIVKYYAVREYGIYLIAEAKAPGKKLKNYKEPVQVYPLPLLNKSKWKTDIQTGKKKINLEYQVESLSEKINIGLTDYTAVHISGKGIAKAFLMKIPMAEDRWVNKEMGTIKSISKRSSSFRAYGPPPDA